MSAARVEAVIAAVERTDPELASATGRVSRTAAASATGRQPVGSDVHEARMGSGPLGEIERALGSNRGLLLRIAPRAEGLQVTVVDSVIATSFPGRLMVAMSRGIMERDLQARFPFCQDRVRHPSIPIS